jgi:hypothetical protein
MKEICQKCQNGRGSPELKAKSPFPWQQRSRSLTLRTSARQKLAGSMVVLRFGMAHREGCGLEKIARSAKIAKNRRKWKAKPYRALPRMSADQEKVSLRLQVGLPGEMS